MKMALTLGTFAGFGNLCLMLIDMIMLCFWEWLFPAASIDVAEDFDFFKYYKDKKSFGDHTFRVDSTKIDKKQ